MLCSCVSTQHTVLCSVAKFTCCAVVCHHNTLCVCVCVFWLMYCRSIPTSSLVVQLCICAFWLVHCRSIATSSLVVQCSCIVAPFRQVHMLCSCVSVHALSLHSDKFACCVYVRTLSLHCDKFTCCAAVCQHNAVLFWLVCHNFQMSSYFLFAVSPSHTCFFLTCCLLFSKMTKIAVETEDEGVRFTRNADGELVAVRVEKKLTIDDDIPPAPTTDSATEDQHCGM